MDVLYHFNQFIRPLFPVLWTWPNWSFVPCPEWQDQGQLPKSNHSKTGHFGSSTSKYKLKIDGFTKNFDYLNEKRKSSFVEPVPCPPLDELIV